MKILHIHMETNIFIAWMHFVRFNLICLLIFSVVVSLMAQLVKNPPAMWETWILSLGWKDPLEKGMTTHSNILSWRIPWTV